MKIELSLNTLDNVGWWIEIGISYHKNNRTKRKNAITLSLVFFNINLVW